MYFTAQEVLWDRRGGGVEKVVINSTSLVSWGKIPFQTHSQTAACRYSCLHTVSSCLLPYCWWHSSSTHDLCVCAIFWHGKMQGGICMNLKIHLSSKKARSREGHFAAWTDMLKACSWHCMADGHFLSVTVSPTRAAWEMLPGRLCLCLQPKINCTEVGEEQHAEATDRNLSPFWNTSSASAQEYAA